MKKNATKALVIVCAVAMSNVANAGNKDRSGQAGASELNINPWAATTGLFGLNGSYVNGMEAMKSNISGLATITGTEIGFSYGLYLKGSNVHIGNLAIGQSLGKIGVVGVNIQSITFGEIPITTTASPEPGSTGTYKPQYFNFQLGYAKNFRNSIHVGVAATFVTEEINNIGASGIGLDAGIQYNTGKRNNFHFGVTLRNIGTDLRFSGDGFAQDYTFPSTEGEYSSSRSTRSEQFSLPTNLNIATSYDFYLDENHRSSNADNKAKHRLTAMASFISNTYGSDYIGGGLEYAFKEQFMLRGAYRYEEKFAEGGANSFYTGFSAGASIATHAGNGGPRMIFDYSFRPTSHPNNGVHMFSIRLMRGASAKKAAAPTEETSGAQ